MAGFDEAHLALLVPFPLWVSTLVLLLAAGVMALSAWNLRDAQPTRRLKLLLLRLVVVLLALYLYAQPAVQLQDVTRVKNHLVVLVDGSLSMSLRDGPKTPRRVERVQRFLREMSPELVGLGRDHVLDVFTFGDLLKEASTDALAEKAPTNAEATQLLEALTEVSARYKGKELAAVVVLSDGGDNGVLGQRTPLKRPLDPDLVERLRRFDVPIHTLAAGRPDGLVDLAIQRVLANEFAFVHNLTEVEVVLQAQGLGKKRVTVTLERDGNPIQSRALQLDARGGEHSVRFSFSPERVGKFVYSVRAEAFPEEAIQTNNRRDFVLKVIRDKVRVLQVAGRPSWDQRFLRKVLKRNPNVDLISFFILRTSANLHTVPPSQLSLIPFPTRELFQEELRSFDVVILQDFDYRPYQMARYLRHIAEFVREGGGLLMIGGSQSFSAGGYYGTELAEVLPVQIGPEGFDESMLSFDTFSARLTAAGQRHPVTALSPDRRENEAIWRSFPILEGLNLVDAVKPGAVVLAQHPLLKDLRGDQLPLVVLGHSGRGRSLAVLTDSTWRWALPAAASGGGARYHQRFWNNALRWLLADPEWKLIKVQTDRDVVLPGEPVRVQVSVVDRSYKPATGIDLKIHLRQVSSSVGDGAGSVHELYSGPVGEGGRVSVTVAAPQAGAQRISARAVIAGEPEEASAVFLVGGARPELDDAGVREDLLRAVARATGGEYHRIDSASLSELPRRKPRIVRVDRRHNVSLWDHPLVLMLGVLCMASEWWLRRRYGYL